MKNGFTEQYSESLKEQMSIIEEALARGVTSWEEYNKLVGKHGGIASALAYFNDLVDALNNQE